MANRNSKLPLFKFGLAIGRSLNVEGIIMEMYRNLGGNSGVAAYGLEHDSITVQFNDGAIYLYNYVSAGRSNIETMKTLAAAGQGLNSFIMQHVRKSYAAKLR